MVLQNNLYKTKFFTTRLKFHSDAVSCNEIRKRFLDYFVLFNSHTFIRSSPIVPLHDKSLAFVNAGMNQFKDILLGKATAPCLRAANSQKCIRVGGTHNDLKSVGLDSYHHTFFEMLGNWSFGDYFKKEACKYAWELLTTPPYSIDKKRLYVTYFGGCSELGLPPDLETKEIWQSLGVKPNHILPFGVKDNFWEMGSTGPCGVCTEIHVDLKGNRDAASRVNQGFSDVTELWNIVFIQFNRNNDRSLSTLSRCHVDTGMGFERLVALIQNKESNYDTDIFIPLFDVISKVSKASPYSGKFGAEDKAGLDTAYRILADHCRMTTVAIADNMFPDHNHKLRRVLRKALFLAEETFKIENAANLMKEVSNTIAESFLKSYPEIGSNLKKVHLVFDHEWELMKALQGEATEAWRSLVQNDKRLAELQLTGYEAKGLSAAYKDLMEATKITGDLTFHLYETHGLPPDLIKELYEALGLEFNEEELKIKLEEAKIKTLHLLQKNLSEVHTSKTLEKLQCKFSSTDDSAKYIYSRTVDSNSQVKYCFPVVESVVQAVISEGEVVDEGRVGETVGLVLDRTCLYHEGGGQQADKGEVRGEGWTLHCVTVLNWGGFILHLGKIESTSSSRVSKVTAGAKVSVLVDDNRRVANMRNHTATHCLNAVLQEKFSATHQMGSCVTDQNLMFTFATYGQQVTNDHVADVEKRVQQIVKDAYPVTRTTVSSNQLLALDNVTWLPGEVYPSQGIHVIHIQGNDFVSKEACCGTHVLNTSDLEDFYICSLRGHGTGAKSVTAVTGPTAQLARQTGKCALADVRTFKDEVTTTTSTDVQDKIKFDQLSTTLQSLKDKVTEDLMPYVDRLEALAELDSAAKLLKESARSYLRSSIEEEMTEVLKAVNADCNCKFLVHCLSSSSQLDKIPLQKVTKMCPSHLPVLVFAYAENRLKARCCVPKSCFQGIYSTFRNKGFFYSGLWAQRPTLNLEDQGLFSVTFS